MCSILSKLVYIGIVVGELSLEMIRRVGVYINKNIDDVSDFRTTRVFIQGATHIPPEACYVKKLLSELIYKSDGFRGEGIFDYIARFHIAFERIHLLLTVMGEQVEC